MPLGSVRPCVHPSIRSTDRPVVLSFVRPAPSHPVPSFRPFRPSVHSFIRPSVHPSVRPFIRPSAHSAVRSSVYPSVGPSVRSSIHPSYIHPSVHSSIHTYVRQSVRPSVHSSVRPLVCPSVRSFVLSSLFISFSSIPFNPFPSRSVLSPVQRVKLPKSKRIPSSTMVEHIGRVYRHQSVNLSLVMVPETPGGLTWSGGGWESAGLWWSRESRGRT